MPLLKSEMIKDYSLFFFLFFFFFENQRLGVKSIKIYTIVLVLLFYMLSSKTCICIVVNLSHFVL